jgi:hypothetical protein
MNLGLYYGAAQIKTKIKNKNSSYRCVVLMPPLSRIGQSGM